MKSKIFLVDDDPVIIELVSMVLRRESFSVDSATDSRLAFEAIAANPAGYDILICDQKMPYISGSELITKVRGAGFAGKIVVHSGNVDQESESIRIAMGADAILTKPSPIATMVETVRKLAL